MTQLHDIKTEIRFSTRFRKLYPKLDPGIRASFQKKLKLFQQNPRNKNLNNRSLPGNKNARSIQVDSKTLAIYIQKSKSVVIFIFIGDIDDVFV